MLTLHNVNVKCSLNHFLKKIKITATKICFYKNIDINLLNNNFKKMCHGTIMLGSPKTQIKEEEFEGVENNNLGCCC